MVRILKLPTLEECKELAVKQSVTKDWNNTTKWLLKKLDEEYKEFLKAIDEKKPKEIVKEFADFIIVASQLKHNEATHFNMDFIYTEKIKDNYANKKKTWDEKTHRMIRK